MLRAPSTGVDAERVARLLKTPGGSRPGGLCETGSAYERAGAPPSGTARASNDKLARAANRNPLLVFLGGALVTVLLSSCDGRSHEMMTGADTWPARFQTNGERIYFTGASESGTPITYTGGNMHLEMMGGGCATCHGADRRGARMMPELWLEAPPLTRAALFQVHEDGHGSHASYDANTLRRAISRGLDPAGTALSPIMPRWSMSDADWRDLLAYLSQ